MYKIEGNNFTIKAEGNKSIFLFAQENDIFLEHSCLTGRCGSCKAKLISGQVEKIGYEEGLTEDEKKENYILTCVCLPKTDLILNIENISFKTLPKPKTIPAKIAELKLINADLLKLTLRVPKSTKFDFLPGQYINLIKNSIKRSYSIANMYENLVEFFIKKYENGLMSDFLFNNAKKEDMVLIEGPFGTFFLKDTSLENIIFFATGTGIAPIYSMLNNPDNLRFLKSKKIFLFHGGRYERDLIEFSFFSGFDLTYFPVLSRELKSGYFSGYIQNICLDQNIDLSASTVYACGSTQMILSAKKKLIDSGLNPKHFYSDAFLMSN